MRMDALTAGHYEPNLTHQLLRGCPCGSPHPIALRSANPTICPNCGAPAQPPSAPRTSRAVLAGGGFGRLLLGIGEALGRLAERLKR